MKGARRRSQRLRAWWDGFVVLLHERTGLTSLANVKEQRYPLRASLREDPTHSPAQGAHRPARTRHGSDAARRPPPPRRSALASRAKQGIAPHPFSSAGAWLRRALAGAPVPPPETIKRPYVPLRKLYNSSCMPFNTSGEGSHPNRRNSSVAGLRA